MKKVLLLLGLCSGFCQAGAQTVLTASLNMAPVGTTDTISFASGVAPGAAGNGVTWDFSNVPLAPVGVGKVVAPSNTPYSSTFPTATQAFEITPFGSTSSMYEYLLKNNSGLYILASEYSAANTMYNYNLNSKLRIPFPFAFGNSVSDTFQKNGSAPDAYIMTYDGFGTLKTPRGIYTNVVRMKYVWIGGEIAYQWFTTAPLAYLASWNQDSGGKLTLIGGSRTTGVENLASDGFEVFPNPAGEWVQLRLPTHLATQKELSCVLHDRTGRILRTAAVQNGEATLQRQQLPAGVYFLEVRVSGRRIHTGRIVFE